LNTSPRRDMAVILIWRSDQLVQALMLVQCVDHHRKLSM
jgi:hypothetical protein